MKIKELESQGLATPTVEVRIEDDTLRRELLVGGRYKLVRHIYGDAKRGSQVWEAVDTLWQTFDDEGPVERKVCLKFFSLPRNYLRHEALERARREAAASELFSPHNTVPVFDFIESAHYACIVFPYLKTKFDIRRQPGLPRHIYLNMADYLQRPNLLFGEMLEILRQWCEWVENAAEDSRYGSDHKPANAFLFYDSEALTPQQRVHLIISDLGSIPEIYNDHSNTQFHKLRSPGTITHCSPERLAYTYAEDPQDRKILTFNQLKAEIFSLDTILYELLVGKNPYLAVLATQGYGALPDEEQSFLIHQMKVDTNYCPVDQRKYFTLPDEVQSGLETHFNCMSEKLQEVVWKGAAPEEERFAAPMALYQEVAACFPTQNTQL